MVLRTATKDENVPRPRTLILVAARDRGRATLDRGRGRSRLYFQLNRDKIKVIHLPLAESFFIGAATLGVPPVFVLAMGDSLEYPKEKLRSRK
jgi:hypothetical protein